MMQTLDFLYHFLNFITGGVFLIYSCSDFFYFFKKGRMGSYQGLFTLTLLFFLLCLYFLIQAFSPPVPRPFDLFILLVIIEAWTAGFGFYYILIRRRARFNEFDIPENNLRLIIKRRAEDIKIWEELETKLSPETFALLQKDSSPLKRADKSR